MLEMGRDIRNDFDIFRQAFLTRSPFRKLRIRVSAAASPLRENIPIRSSMQKGCVRYYLNLLKSDIDRVKDTFGGWIVGNLFIARIRFIKFLGSSGYLYEADALRGNHRAFQTVRCYITVASGLPTSSPTRIGAVRMFRRLLPITDISWAAALYFGFDKASDTNVQQFIPTSARSHTCDGTCVIRLEGVRKIGCSRSSSRGLWISERRSVVQAKDGVFVRSYCNPVRRLSLYEEFLQRGQDQKKQEFYPLEADLQALSSFF